MKRSILSIALLLMMILLIVPAQAAPQLDNITDTAGLLTESEWASLEEQARAISSQYGIGVYIITVEDYTAYTDGYIEDAAEAIYDSYALGLGDNRDGILLLLSMQWRDYDIMVEGPDANYAFCAEGRERLADFFLDDFSVDYWYYGMNDFLTWTADYLENAQNATPYTASNLPMDNYDRIMGIVIRIGIILLLPLLIAGIYILILTSKMKSVAKAVEASAYQAGELDLIRSSDHFTHITTSRRKIERDKSSSSSGSTSHTSGKF